MSLVFKSLVGTLAVASTLAGTVGTTLYVWRCVDFAIHDAVAHQLAELQSEEGMGHVSIDRGEADSETWSVFEAMNQPPEGALMDSRGVAVLIDELCEAGPQEREVWTQLLRRPDSHESYRRLFSYYHGNSPKTSNDPANRRRRLPSFNGRRCRHHLPFQVVRSPEPPIRLPCLDRPSSLCGWRGTCFSSKLSAKNSRHCASATIG